MIKTLATFLFASILISVPLWLINSNSAVESHSATTDNYHSCLHDHFLANMKADTTSPDFFPRIADSYYPAYFEQYPAFRANGFDFPVGIPDAAGYYKALNFGDKNHLGEDWNGRGGGNTDLGDPVHVVANGLVVDAKEVCCGWGNVVRVVHKISDDPAKAFVETVYAHLHTVRVKPGDLIKRGMQIGSIGNAKGRYAAHLHLEMRDFVGMSLGPGYSEDRFGYVDPTGFIRKHRP
jgi:murein DD-endopeptidase MepM/ murein hydrolase activator NlpD